MIKKSAFHRIIFFIAISVSYISYKVVYHAFYEKRLNSGEKEIEAMYDVRYKKEVDYKFSEEGIAEAPFNSYLETTESSAQNSYFTSTSSKKIKKGKVDVRNPNSLVSKGSNSNNSLITKGQSGGVSPIVYEDDNFTTGGGGAIGGGADGSPIVYGGGGSDDNEISITGGGLSLNILSSPSSESGIQGSVSSNSGIGSASRVGISTTPSVGGTSNPTVQAPPPPPPPPVPLDTNSVIFILLGAATGVFVLLRDIRKGSKQTA